ncbi:unnamed protein product [Mytilus edulis]|uniref:Uncharacterized protein n=1 Tax=Mytilus edulis TaxID=6550 RepID=A0A8S3Q2B6_MYTED|nr:unnamed protein product [Mytilus edulis]
MSGGILIEYKLRNQREIFLEINERTEIFLEITERTEIILEDWLANQIGDIIITFLTCSIVEQSNLFSLLGERSKVPDHSVLIAEFKTTCTYSTKSQVPQECVENKRYKLKSIPNDLFASDLSKIALQSIITQIERTRETQTNIDEIYSKLCDVIIDEMNDKIPRFSTSTNTRKRLKMNKPFWNDELRLLWDDMRTKENQFLKFKGKASVKSKLRQDFKSAQTIFDRKLRKCERQHRQSFCIDIEIMTTKNPNEFWEKIKRLGPRKSKLIPMEVYNTEGEILIDETRVLDIVR